MSAILRFEKDGDYVEFKKEEDGLLRIGSSSEDVDAYSSITIDKDEVEDLIHFLTRELERTKEKDNKRIIEVNTDKHLIKNGR